MLSRTTVAMLLGVLVFSSPVAAKDPALYRIERRTIGDRDALLRHRVGVVYERDQCLLALGDPADIESRLSWLGYDFCVLDSDTKGWIYYTASLRDGRDVRAAAPSGCGEVVLSEGNWVVIRAAAELPTECTGSGTWHLHRIDLESFDRAEPPPAEYRHLQRGALQPMAPKPLVQTIVNSVTPAAVDANWDEIVNAATTRYSTSTGCQTAVEVVYNKFAGLGLNPTYQQFRSGYAPNVIGVIEGRVSPEKVYIIIGHLDDMPSHGAAPGADDNASGTAAVTTAAQAMSGYAFASTVKFIAVTGEEQDLYGSKAYADAARNRGEQIQAVLNADMIAWQGDSPGSENLDVNYNNSSQWLGQIMTQCAADYSTGCAVDAFLCPAATWSDHSPFWNGGFSAVCGITDNEDECGHGGSYPYYHTSNDTQANCGDPAFFGSAVRAYVATLAHLADPLCSAPFPDPPSGLTADASAAGRIALQWPPAGSGLAYEVWRSTVGCSTMNPFAKIGETGSTTYDDTSVLEGVTYFYYIRSRIGTCPSAASPCASATAWTSCTYTIVPEGQAFDAAGGTGSVTITAPTPCAWTAGSNDPSWLTVTAGQSGTGNGSVRYTVAANVGTAARTGTMLIGGRTLTVTQSGQGVTCTYAIDPLTQRFPASGGAGAIQVSAPAGCAWTAASVGSAWIHITSGVAGSGNGVVDYSVAANATASERTGTVSAAGHLFTVVQDGGTGAFIFRDDFEDGSAGDWRSGKGHWGVVSGALQGEISRRGAAWSPVFDRCSECTVEATLSVSTPGTSASVVGWYQDKKNQVLVTLSDSRNQIRLQHLVNGRSEAGKTFRKQIVPGKTYNLKIAYSGGAFTIAVDGKALSAVSAKTAPSGNRVGFRVESKSGSGVAALDEISVY